MAAHYYHLSADQGNARAQCEYGRCLETGSGTAVDLDLAAHYYELSADQLDPAGQFGYAELLLKRSPVFAAIAARHYKLSADQGLAVSQCAYGFCLQNGRGVPADPALAAEYYRRAADQGDRAGQCNYAACLASGTGVEKDLAAAAEYYRRSAEQGHAPAQAHYGCCLEDGRGVSLNTELAVSFYQKAAAQGDPGGLFCLGRCYEHGRGLAVDFGEAVAHYKRAADLGDARAEFRYGISLEAGQGVAMDLPSAAHYFFLSAIHGFPRAMYKHAVCLESGRGVPQRMDRALAWYAMAADSSDLDAQFIYGCCLEIGKGCRPNLEGAARYYKLAAERGHAAAQYKYGVCLERGRGVARNPGAAMAFFERAAAQGDPNARFVFPKYRDAFRRPRSLRALADGGNFRAQILFAGLIQRTDAVLGATFYERAAEFSGVAAACCGWCLQAGIGVPVDFTTAAEFFQIAADAGNSDGENQLGVCLDLGRGVDRDLPRAVRYYLRAASAGHPAALNNVGRLFESGVEFAPDQCRAARYYRRAAELGNPDALNNFGICLERGVGVRANMELAADFYRRAADAGHADGANNFGFCLEHGRGVEQDVAAAAKSYRRAADAGHPEALLNYNRCLRLIGKWPLPDRFTKPSEQQPALEERVPQKRDIVQIPNFVKDPMGAKIMKRCRIAPPFAARLSRTSRLARDGNAYREIRTYRVFGPAAALFERRTAIYSALDHPLILGFEGPAVDGSQRLPVHVLEFAPNGSLADHMPRAGQAGNEWIHGETRIAIIVVGIVLAMRYIHSHGIIHRDLTPENIFLDWNYIVRVGEFSQCLSLAVSNPLFGHEVLESGSVLRADSRYTAPECFDNAPHLKSDVYSFGLILYEMLVGRPAFPTEYRLLAIMRMVALEHARPEIPEFIGPETARLIRQCWKQNPDKRPSFCVILDILKRMDFKITPGVNSVRVNYFVESIEGREKLIENNRKN